jgi:NitT/TauT family transport system substrate-binding protein
MPINRRTFLLATAAGMIAAPSVVRAQTATTFRLNVYITGLHAPYFLGQERGLFAKEQIDLTIGEGRGSAATVQAIAARSDDFGMADSGSLIALASQGAPVKAVMSVLNSTSFGIVSLAANPISTGADMKGKKFAAFASGGPALLFPAVLAANGLTRDDVSLIQVDPAAVPVTVMEGQADALLGGVDDQPFGMEQRGFRTHSVTYAELGVDFVGMTIIAHEDTIRDRSDLVARFVAAAQQCWMEAADDPAAAVEATLKAKPDLNPEVVAGQLKIGLGLVHSPATRGHPIGWAAPEDYERTLQLVREYRSVQTDRPASSFFTNEFVPTTAG